MDEKYVLQKEIGHGCTCRVFLAEHSGLHHKCAIKRMEKTQDAYNIFLKEAEFLRNLGNLYNPVLYDIDEDENFLYLIEEYIAGESLKDLKQNHEFIPQERVIEIAVQICQAVNWLHRRKPYPVLFLDLKPEHIIMTKQGLKFLDFGSAVYLRENCIIGKVMGTQGFASPELRQGRDLDEQTDVYGIGAVLYWLMCGKTLEQSFPKDKIAGYSKKWMRIVLRCVQENREQRYVSVEQILSDIRKMKVHTTGQLGKSMTIAVIGSQPRAGATHFSIGLCIGCEKSGIKCLYEEKNESGAIESMFREWNDVKQHDGIYHFPGFRAVPYYGKAVKEEDYEERVIIRDYGCFQKELVKKYEEADAIIVVAGGKAWEMQWTRDLTVRYKQQKNLYYVLRTNDFRDFRKKVHILGIRKAFSMICYENPFRLRKKELRFYKAILKQIGKEIKGSIKL